MRLESHSAIATLDEPKPSRRLVTFDELYTDYFELLFAQGRLFEGIVQADDRDNGLAWLKEYWVKYEHPEDGPFRGENKLYVVHKNKGDELCRRSDPASETPLRVLLSGSAQALFEEGGKLFPVYEFGPGDIFGEIEFLARHSIMRGKSSRADVVATSDVTFLQFGFSDRIYSLPTIYGFFWRNMARMIAERMIQTPNAFHALPDVGGTKRRKVATQHENHKLFSVIIARNIRNFLCGDKPGQYGFFERNAKFVRDSSTFVEHEVADRTWAAYSKELTVGDMRSLLMPPERGTKLRSFINNMFKSNLEVRRGDKGFHDWLLLPGESSYKRVLLLSEDFRKRIVVEIPIEHREAAIHFLNLE